MSKFIKVTGKLSGEEKIIFTSGIDEIVKDGNDGSVIYDDGSKLFVRESLEQIEAQLLRDEFANNAMQAILNAITIPEGTSNYDLCAYNEQVANHAYVIADAMIKERMK